MTEFFSRESEKPKCQRIRNAMPRADVFVGGRLMGRELLGCKFRTQFGVGACVIDFSAPEFRMGIELDGDSYFQPRARQCGEARRAFIESFPFKLLRFLNKGVYENFDGVIEAIRRQISKRRRSIDSPLTPSSQAGDCDIGSARSRRSRNTRSVCLAHPLAKGVPAGVARAAPELISPPGNTPQRRRQHVPDPDALSIKRLSSAEPRYL
jgi:very-short-patch-repair endonuclease